LGEPIGGDDDAITTPTTADPDGAAFQLGVERDLATGEEGISVNVQNAIVAGAHRVRAALASQTR